MRSRSLAVRTVLPALSFAVMLAVAACAPIPTFPAPTAVAPTTAPPTEPAPLNATPVPPELATPVATAPITPTVSSPVTATVVVTVTVPETSTAPDAATPTPAVAASSPATPTFAAPAWTAAIYRDEVGGWEIHYPDTWSLTDVAPETKQESLGYSVTLTSWQPQEPGGQGIPQGGSKIDIGVTKGGAASPEAALGARRAEIVEGDAGTQIVFEEPWDLPSGLSGVHWTIQPSRGETVHEFVTAINGNRVVLSAFGDEAMFEQIVSTLRPLGGETRAEEVLVPMVAAGGANDTAAAAALLASTTYTVRAGDTLARIAARFGVSVQVIMAANPQITNPDRIYIGQRITIPKGSAQPPTPAPGTTRVNIYMIGIGGGGVGCGDQVVPVRRDVPRTNAPLTAALNLLLSQKSQYYGESGLYNALHQSDLRIASITRSGSAWTINLAGTLRIGGTCDSPRVQAQLGQTALQFSTVKSVRYFVNGVALETLLSGR
jgi:hypothetical protein